MQRDETKVDVNPRGRICSKRPRQRNGEIARALLRFLPSTLQPDRYCQPQACCSGSRSVCLAPISNAVDPCRTSVTPKENSVPRTLQAGTAVADAPPGVARHQASSWHWPRGVTPASSTTMLAAARTGTGCHNAKKASRLGEYRNTFIDVLKTSAELLRDSVSRRAQRQIVASAYRMRAIGVPGPEYMRGTSRCRPPAPRTCGTQLLRSDGGRSQCTGGNRAQHASWRDCVS